MNTETTEKKSGYAVIMRKFDELIDAIEESDPKHFSTLQMNDITMYSSKHLRNAVGNLREKIKENRFS